MIPAMEEWSLTCDSSYGRVESHVLAYAAGIHVKLSFPGRQYARVSTACSAQLGQVFSDHKQGKAHSVHTTHCSATLHLMRHGKTIGVLRDLGFAANVVGLRFMTHLMLTPRLTMQLT